jgi:hypothetical protein
MHRRKQLFNVARVYRHVPRLVPQLYQYPVVHKEKDVLGAARIVGVAQTLKHEPKHLHMYSNLRYLHHSPATDAFDAIDTTRQSYIYKPPHETRSRSSAGDIGVGDSDEAHATTTGIDTANSTADDENNEEWQAIMSMTMMPDVRQVYSSDLLLPHELCHHPSDVPQQSADQQPSVQKAASHPYIVGNHDNPFQTEAAEVVAAAGGDHAIPPWPDIGIHSVTGGIDKPFILDSNNHMKEKAKSQAEQQCGDQTVAAAAAAAAIAAEEEIDEAVAAPAVAVVAVAPVGHASGEKSSGESYTSTSSYDDCSASITQKMHITDDSLLHKEEAAAAKLDDGT